jgi:hypothetical protein
MVAQSHAKLAICGIPIRTQKAEHACDALLGATVSNLNAAVVESPVSMEMVPSSGERRKLVLPWTTEGRARTTT